MARTAIHPGEHLAEAIRACGIAAARLARDIEVPANQITGILHGTRGITPVIALRLGRYFDVSAAFWKNLQRIFDLRLAEQEIGDGLSRNSTRHVGRGRTSSNKRQGKSGQRAVG